MTEQLSLHFIPTSSYFLCHKSALSIMANFTIDRTDSDSFRTDFHLQKAVRPLGFDSDNLGINSGFITVMV